MIEVKDSTYKNTSVRLDNTSYENCTFVNCKMVFSGSGPISLVNCTFSNVSWHMEGAAENTLTFLRAMYHGMGEEGKKIVEATFDEIRAQPGT